MRESVLDFLLSRKLAGRTVAEWHDLNGLDAPYARELSRHLHRNRRAAMGAMGQGSLSPAVGIQGGVAVYTRSPAGAEAAYTAATFSLPRVARVLGARVAVSASSCDIRFLPNLGADQLDEPVTVNRASPGIIPLAKAIPGPVPSIALSTEGDAAQAIRAAFVYL